MCLLEAKKRSSQVLVRNWSNSAQYFKVPYPESLRDLEKSICFETLIDPPLKLYYLGDSKIFEARVKIDSDAVLEASLDKIDSWKCRSGAIVPEILFQHGSSSPITTPFKLLWEGQQGRPAAAADDQNRASSSPTSRASRLGQSIFSEGVRTRDLGQCVFCDSKENLTAAHLIAYKAIDSSAVAPLTLLFSKCCISNIQATENGITLCQSCHEQFDHHFVGVNPDTMLVEVSGALLYSRNPDIRLKWSKIAGKRIAARSTMGHWPSVEAFRVKYDVFLANTNSCSRRAKQKEFLAFCGTCGKGCKNSRGLKQHQIQNGCISYAASANRIRNQFSTTKAARSGGGGGGGGAGGGGKVSADHHGAVVCKEKEVEADQVENAGQKGRRRRSSRQPALHTSINKLHLQ